MYYCIKGQGRLRQFQQTLFKDLSRVVLLLTPGAKRYTGLQWGEKNYVKFSLQSIWNIRPRVHPWICKNIVNDLDIELNFDFRCRKYMEKCSSGSLNKIKTSLSYTAKGLMKTLWYRCLLGLLLALESVDMNHTENPARAPSAKEGFWKIAAIRPLFSWEGLTQKGLLSAALIRLCQAWSSSHIRHTNDRQPGALSHAKQKGPHSLRIPTREHILQQGEEWDTGSPLGIGWERHFLCRGSYQLCLCFFPPLCLHYLHPSIISTSHSVSRSPHPPIGIVRLHLKRWYNIYCIREHTEENTAMQMFRQVFQGMTQTRRTTGVWHRDCCCQAAHCKAFSYMRVCVIRALHQQKRKKWVDSVS